ncbi:MAG TPA: hypothetical protein VK915_08305 [Gaiellaceae bacterium]|nr:hypothetical protein [Gaiellaceae bacterium]
MHHSKWITAPRGMTSGSPEPTSVGVSSTGQQLGEKRFADLRGLLLDLTQLIENAGTPAER